MCRCVPSLRLPSLTSVHRQVEEYKIGLLGHLLAAINGSSLSLIAALESHRKLKVMHEEDLLAGMPEGTYALCVCILHLPHFGVCLPSHAVTQSAVSHSASHPVT